MKCGGIPLHRVIAVSLLIYLQRIFPGVHFSPANLANERRSENPALTCNYITACCPFIALLIRSFLYALFLLPPFWPSPSALFLSQHPAANPICPFLSAGSSLPAGREQRLPEERTGVATHTSLSNQVPVASGRRVSSNDALTRTHMAARRAVRENEANIEKPCAMLKLTLSPVWKSRQSILTPSKIDLLCLSPFSLQRWREKLVLSELSLPQRSTDC